MTNITISGTSFEVERISNYWLKVRMPGSDEFIDLVAPDNDNISWRLIAPEPNYFLAYKIQQAFFSAKAPARKIEKSVY